MKSAMKTVRQEDENDCGVACVAMLTGADYAEVRNALYPLGRVRKLKTAELCAALKAFGRKPVGDRRRPFGAKTLQELPSDALVFVTLHNNGAEHRHWIVWDATAKKPRDPYRPKCEYDLRGYILVE